MKALAIKSSLFSCLKTYNKKTFMSDLMAGIIVGIVALPLAIAFGIASGVTPEKGIITAIVAGLIISIFGGSKVQIGGPTGAFIVIIYGIIQKYGMEGLTIATLMAGLFLVLFGLLRLGTIIKYIPYPIVVGFTSGIAVTIFTTQIKDLFGLTLTSNPSDFLEKWGVYFQSFDTIDPWCALIGIVSVVVIAITPKFSKKIPGSLIAIILMKFDYGPMKQYEKKASSGDLSALESEESETINPKGHLLDLILPVVVLIITCTIGMLYVGGFFGADTSGCTDYAGDFIGAFGNTDAFVGLPWGGIIALVLTVIYLVARRVVGFREAMGCIPKGFQAMISPIIILTLAVSLKTTLNALDAAGFVHDLMQAASTGLYNMLPAVIFLVACVLAFASGTSWGTFGILIPIVTAIFPGDSALLYIGISACCAGAVCGDHCSPISDTTIMSSAGAQVEHVNHVATQLPYAITVACLSFVCFVLAGFVQNWVVCLAIGIVLTIATLFAIRNVETRKARIKD